MLATTMPTRVPILRRDMAGGGVSRAGSSERGHGSQIAGTKPRGRFLALELAQASFKSLQVVVTHDLVTARGGWLLRIVTGRKARCYWLCARLLRRVRRPKRIPVTLDRMPFRASALAC